MTVVIGTSNFLDTRRTRSMRSHWEMRSGNVEMMISSNVWVLATRSIEATGSPRTTSPSASTPAARSQLSRASSRPRAVLSRYSSVSRSMTAMPPMAPPASTGTGAENGTTTTNVEIGFDLMTFRRCAARPSPPNVLLATTKNDATPYLLLSPYHRK